MIAGTENNYNNSSIIALYYIICYNLLKVIGSVAALQSSVVSAANLLDFYEVEGGAAAGVVLNHKSCY